MSASTIENMVSHLSPTKFTSRSLDTLLAQMQKDQARDEILNESNYKELGATVNNDKSPLVTKSFGAVATRRKTDLEFSDSEREMRLVQPDEQSKPLIPSSAHRRHKVDNESQLAPINSLTRYADATPRTTLTKPAAIKEPLSKTTTSQMEGSGVEEFYKNKLSFAKSYKDDGYTTAYFDEMYVTNSNEKEEE
ncbi:PREDICTED: uncharacterized protein LOC108567834 isoform X2 [Nicrophorus vespilloides]|uniref:Uncharacterized protein LOC108567834 isoform X2 n=1 Tax=Nicrophorus vespilloides TaxID=110193 RepID=A0ABM1NB33_NICVS|nr:PREDICTED: uncharacterized protein LOC108567834 isoform X2 [Nicrophorus vespilloides]